MEDVRIRVQGDADGFTALLRKLSEERGLRGAVSVERPKAGSDQLGALPDILSIAVGSGGALTVLAAALKSWLADRKQPPNVITYVRGEHGEQSLTVNLESIDGIVALLRQTLAADDRNE